MGGPVHRSVLCVDDTIDGEEFDRQFLQHGTFRGGDGIEARLVRQGPVGESLGQARAALLRALNNDSPPSAILIDDYLKAGNGQLRRDGLRLMLEITKECGRRGHERPVCILWTQGEGERDPPSPDPCLCHTFRELGGHHVVDKRLAWPERMAIVRRALAGERWEPRPQPPRPRLTKSIEALLPYLEQDRTVNEIARGLGRLDQRIREQRNELVKRIREELGLDLGGHGRTTALADACKAGGHVWVLLPLRSMVVEAGLIVPHGPAGARGAGLGHSCVHAYGSLG
ncbi:MAG: hypothetical protein J0H06_16720 [Actinobacteria bacterium]|nr:hypothetical protein [Actinomycetota bacterium]